MPQYQRPDGRQHWIQADMEGSRPIELFNVLRRQEIRASEEGRKIVSDAVLDARGWLPFAAEKYRISANLEDYVVVPTKVMVNDYPNRNIVGFPYTELTCFNPDVGMLAYQTWKGKPTFMEHNNQDYSVAKGAILDSQMRRLHGFKDEPWQVLHLLAFDRNRDPMLGNAILRRERNAFSMGAYCRDYTCSVCGKSTNDGGCEHVDLRNPQFKFYNGDILAYLQAIDFVGFECSSVANPAYSYAYNDFMFDLKPESPVDLRYFGGDEERTA